MNCLIIEDEKPAQRVLQQFIANSPGLELRATFKTAMEAQHFLNTGEVDLISKLKGAYFRLSDFASEYEFPEFKHRDGDPWFDYQNVMKEMEGYPELMKEK